VEIGTQIEGRYVVERTLASGGMATVHVVRHLALDSLHALKVLHIPSPEIRERLLLEGRLQARLRHPNIVAVTDTLTIEGAPGLVMEFVDGPALDEWLGEHRPSLDQAESIFLGILAAVDHAHRHGVVHRDLKPANVLLAPMAGGLLPKVADFGIAKVVEDILGAKGGGRVKTRTGVAMGTPAYMAPEQIEGARSLGPQADIFALGCILYDLIVGRPAFDGPTLLSILTASREGFFDDPAEAVPGLPDRVVQAIRGALAPEIEDRIADCTTLARVLTGGRVATLSGSGPVLATEPIALPDSRYPRGLGSNPRRSQETFRPDDLPDRAGPSAASRAAIEAAGQPALNQASGDRARTGGGQRWAPMTQPEIREVRDRRRNRKLFALWFVIASAVLGLGAIAVILVLVGAAGVAWIGLSGAGADGPDSALVPVDVESPGPGDLQPLRPYRPPPQPSIEPVNEPAPELEPAPEPPVAQGGGTPTVQPEPVRTRPDPPRDSPSSGDGVAAAGPTELAPQPDVAAPEPSPRLADLRPAPEPQLVAPSTSGEPWRVVVLRSRSVSESRSGVFTHRPASGHHLLILEVGVTNRSGRTVEPKAPFRLRAGGASYEVHGACRLALPGSFSLVPDLRDGQETRGSLCFEVPASVRSGTLSFAPGSGQPPVETRF